MVLRRKEVGNPDDYFDKSFEEYENGFESKGNLEVMHNWITKRNHGRFILVKN